jgi:hypothetical protein
MCHVDGQGCEAWNVEAGGHGRMEAGTIARLQCGASGALLREGWSLRKGQLNRHTRYRPATTTRNTATQRSCHSVD